MTVQVLEAAGRMHAHFMEICDDLEPLPLLISNRWDALEDTELAMAKVATI